MDKIHIFTFVCCAATTLCDLCNASAKQHEFSKTRPNCAANSPKTQLHMDVFGLPWYIFCFWKRSQQTVFSFPCLWLAWISFWRKCFSRRTEGLFYSEPTIFNVLSSLRWRVIRTAVCLTCYRVICKLLASKSESIRVQALKVLGYFLKHLGHKSVLLFSFCVVFGAR